MTFNPHTAEDRAEMLAAVGVASVEELFSGIPEDIRRPDLHLPPKLTEMEAAARMTELAGKNMQIAPAWRVLYGLHPLPTGSGAGDAPGDLRVPEHGCGPARDRSRQCVAVRRS